MVVVLQNGAAWWRFENPVRLVTAVSPADVLPALQEIETAVSQGLYAAGFLTYEAAAAFGLSVHPPAGLPLLQFGLYEQYSVDSGQYSVDSGQWAVGSGQSPISNLRSPIHNTPSPISPQTYYQALEQIKQHIANGLTYQVNYTFPLQAGFEGEPFALFCQLAAAQRGQYMAYVEMGQVAICSASPELFFRLDGQVLTSKPMKGTAVRGLTLWQDQQNIIWLQQSEKNRAENVMIVDMIRNDMGRIAQTGSVRVPTLFEVERYPTVLQMTSTVTAQTTASVTDILTAMFPCASITGAPKVRTMQIIHELEPQPRGVYTGSIGFITPHRQAQFNVAIRTVTVDRLAKTAVYHVGSGIVWDSQPEAEYEECLLKAQVWQRKRPNFELLESLVWGRSYQQSAISSQELAVGGWQKGYFLLAAHVERLRQSAEYFQILLSLGDLMNQLEQLAARLTGPCKVRVVVGQNGRISLHTEPLAKGNLPEPVRLGLAADPIHFGNTWLYHKTTHRQMYEAARASRPDCDDVILWNERGEITEASSSNVVVELEGQLWTPPVSSGLLAGTFRGVLLKNGRIQERPLFPSDLANSTTLYLINSVRGWKTAVWEKV